MLGFFNKKPEIHYFIESLNQVVVPLCLNSATSIGLVNKWSPLDRRNDYAATMFFSVAFVFLQPLAGKSKSVSDRKLLESLFSEKFYTNFRFSEISREVGAKETMLNCSVQVKQLLEKCMNSGTVGTAAYLITLNDIFSEVFESFDKEKSYAIFFDYLKQLASIYQQGLEISK